MTADVREFVLDCPVCQVEKGSHLKPGGQLQPLELTSEKVGPCSIRFRCGNAKIGRI